MNVWVNVKTLRQFHLARRVIGSLAIHARRPWCCWESSSHPQLFKDWSSCIRVRMCAGPSAQARRLFVAVYSRSHFPLSFHTPRLLSCSSAVEMELIRVYMCFSLSLALSLSVTHSPPSPLYILNALSRAHVCTHGLTHRSTQRWLCKWSYSSNEQNAVHAVRNVW